MKSSTDLQGFIHREWNWPISCLNDSETQERGLHGVKIQKIFRGEHFLHLQRSFRKLASIYPTSMPGYLHSSFYTKQLLDEVFVISGIIKVEIIH